MKSFDMNTVIKIGGELTCPLTPHISIVERQLYFLGGLSLLLHLYFHKGGETSLILIRGRRN